MITRNLRIVSSVYRVFSTNIRKSSILSENLLINAVPAVAKEWHPTKNGLLKPDDVSYGSTKRVWWKCENGHEWESTIHSRTNNKSRISYC